MSVVGQQDQGLVAEAAATLPWLPPSADALIQLTRDSVLVDRLANEMELLILVLRYVRSAAIPETFTLNGIRETIVLESAARFLTSNSPPRVPRSNPYRQTLDRESRQLAGICRRIAKRATTVSPGTAEVLGLLASLGLYACLTGYLQLTQRASTADLRDPISWEKPLRNRLIDVEPVTRRLVAYWRLPGWIGATISTVSLNLEQAIALGADREFSKILRLAIWELDSSQESDSSQETHGNHEPSSDRNSAWHPNSLTGNSYETDDDPKTLKLLPDLLRTVGKYRRVSHDRRLREVEAEIDKLRGMLGQIQEESEQSLREAKLSSLAEFAAGAGHEINNPLAVISGHAQRLFKSEQDLERKKSLDTVLRHTARISHIIRDLMTFARPQTPLRTLVDLCHLIQLCLGDNRPAAALNGVDFLFVPSVTPVTVSVDLTQMRKVINALLENALDATTNGGEITLEVVPSATHVALRILDNGSGVSDETAEHLFDPFYSGRSAGRGRGFGLSMAWSLARVNDAQLEYAGCHEGRTIFQLTLERAKTLDHPRRVSA